jgi:hypothetical protein
MVEEADILEMDIPRVVKELHTNQTCFMTEE